MINEILKSVLVAILPILTGYLVTYCHTKIAELKLKVKSTEKAQYLDDLDRIISECVVATNQTFVQELKEQGDFTPDAQKAAFLKTANSVLDIAKPEILDYISTITGDLNKYIEQKVEYFVNTLK